MKVAVIGSRNFNDYDLLTMVLKGFKVKTIVSGGASGADSLAERFAKEHNIPIKIFKADWQDFSEPCVIKVNNFGKYNALAGHKRNEKVVSDVDVVIAFWDGKSSGTKDAIKKAESKGITVTIVRF